MAHLSMVVSLTTCGATSALHAGVSGYGHYRHQQGEAIPVNNGLLSNLLHSSLSKNLRYSDGYGCHRHHRHHGLSTEPLSFSISRRKLQHPAGCDHKINLSETRVSRSAVIIKAIAASDIETADANSETNPVKRAVELELSCPICYERVIRSGPSGLNRKSLRSCTFRCDGCSRVFPNQQGYIDLTIVGGSRTYSEAQNLGSELFRSPLISFAYERGWRQSFIRSGALGADKEFNLAQEYFQPARGGILVDASCGSGLFTRRFAQSGDYGAVIALDFSEAMLQQTEQYIQEDRSLDNSDIALVRADIARLPFASKSIDAVHAGAALHCWSSPATAVAEITRVLKPGGVFVASTFMTSPAAMFDNIGAAISQVTQVSSMFHAWKEDELEELVKICGLVDYSMYRNSGFIIFRAKKP